MGLPYQSATSGTKAIADIEKILRKFGCSKFATGQDWETGEIFIQFEHRGRMVNFKASARGYAAAWLQENPWNSRRQSTRAEWESRALEIGGVAVYSIIRDWVKSQITVIETGLRTFDATFLADIMLPSGESMIEHVSSAGWLLPATEAENADS